MTQHNLPFQARSHTSRAAAAAKTASKAQTERGRVFQWIRSTGSRGSTDDEGQDHLGMAGSTYRPRRVELWRKGKVTEAGATRPTKAGRQATVWVAKEDRA